MKLSQVYELSKEKLKELYSIVVAKHVCYSILVAVVICLAGFFFLYPILKIEKLEQKLRNLNNEIRNDVHNSSRRFINEHISAAINKMQLKTKAEPAPNTGQELRQSFEDIRKHLNILILKSANLGAVLILNCSSDSKMSRLFWKLNSTKNKLVRLRTKLIMLNYSVHSDMVPFVAKAVSDLRQGLDMLRNSTTAKVGELWKRWGRTDTEIEDVVKLFAQQNQTFRFKMAHHLDLLFSEVKDVEKKQSKMYNNTKGMITHLLGKWNETRHGNQKSVDNQIVPVNKTWHEALQDAVESLHLSVARIDAKVNEIKQEFQKHKNISISKQSEIKDDLLKAKANFQENDGRHDLKISDQALKIDRILERVVKLEHERKSDLQIIQDLKDRRQSDSRIIQDLKDKRKSDSQIILDLKDKRKAESQMIQDLKSKQKLDSQTIQDLKSEQKSNAQKIDNLEDKRKSDSQMIRDFKNKQKSDSQKIYNLENKIKSDSRKIHDLAHEWKWDWQMIVIFVLIGINFILAFILSFVHCRLSRHFQHAKIYTKIIDN